MDTRLIQPRCHLDLANGPPITAASRGLSVTRLVVVRRREMSRDDNRERWLANSYCLIVLIVEFWSSM